MVTPDTKKYWKQLGQIPWNTRGEIRTKFVPWIYTNDHKFKDIYDAVRAGILAQKRSGRLRAAVLSGVGSLLNIAPILDVDFIVSVDRNSFVLDQVRRMVQNVQDAPTRKDYENIDQQKTFFSDLSAVGVNPASYYGMERESFGDWHILADDHVYESTRRVLQKIPVYYSQGNFVHKRYVVALRQALDGADISYAGFTDLAEWSPEFLDIVCHLPLISDSVIVWSTNYGQPEGKPVAKMSVGLDAYISEQRVLLSGNSVQYFKAHV